MLRLILKVVIKSAADIGNYKSTSAADVGNGESTAAAAAAAAAAISDIGNDESTSAAAADIGNDKSTSASVVAADIGNDESKSAADIGNDESTAASADIGNGDSTPLSGASSSSDSSTMSERLAKLEEKECSRNQKLETVQNSDVQDLIEFIKTSDAIRKNDMIYLKNKIAKKISSLEVASAAQVKEFTYLRDCVNQDGNEVKIEREKMKKIPVVRDTDFKSLPWTVVNYEDIAINKVVVLDKARIL